MWQWYAVVAMVCFAAMQLSFKHLTRLGLGTPVMLLFVFAFGAVFYVVHVRVMRTPLLVSMSVLALLAATAALAYIGNFFSVRAVATAPNPGYAAAIVGLQAAAVTLISVAFFGSALSWAKGLGVALCCAGVALLLM